MYNHLEIEPKWREFWDKNKTHKTENDFSKPKFYALDMFPYPSGAGLHVGHPKGYTANDVLARYKHANGYNVLHPMGWDAFGLPAENYAIKTGTHPRITTDNNINTFKNQIKALGMSYDWDREVDTTDPKYYKWTQWIFLKMFEHGLAYEQDLPINYCPSCKTGLANEEVLNDFTCERCGTKVEKKKIRQWVLAITKYADRLAKDVDRLDWPEGIKEMQRNWIGRSEGCEFELKKAVVNKPLAIILHGWKQEEKGWEHNEWQTKLKSDLEVLGYEVAMPSLPNPHKPELEKQLEFLEQYKDRIDENTVVIGHSMGGHLAMHFVERLNKKINKLICVGPCFNGLIDNVDWSSDIGWQEVKASMKIDYNPEKVKQNTKDWKVFLSDNDEFILYDLATKHFDEAGVEHIDFEKAGHFTTKDGCADFKELFDEITDGIRVYTTRVDTVFGMTYSVLAPDHKDVEKFITPEYKADCEAYIEEANKKSDLDRTELNKDKTGIFTGSYVINPFNGKKVPLWIADYVLGNYGTGAVMAVPAHDERDYEFAKKYDLEIIQSIAPFYTDKDGLDKPREDKETIARKTIGGILRNPKTEEYYVLDWEKFGWKSFIIGGVDSSETYEEAVLREIKEETGYQNLKLVKQIGGEYHENFFAKHKDVNRYAFTRAFLVDLVDDEFIAPDENETQNHKGAWIKKEEVGNFVTINGHKNAWEILNSCEKATTDYGVVIDSGEFTGLSSEKAKKAMTKFSQDNGFGELKVNYKLRDWLFSRQRYWGEPIPLIHLKGEDINALPELKFDHEIVFDKIKNGEKTMRIFEKSIEDTVGEFKAGNAIVINLGGKEQLLAIVEEVSEYADFVELHKQRVNLGEEESMSLEDFKERFAWTEKENNFKGVKFKVISKIYDGIYTKIVCDYNLPLQLPQVEDYEPAGDGQSPLARVPDFVNVKLADNLSGERETNTMPQWGGSCWYYLRFMDNLNDDDLVGKDAGNYWGEVDSYVGGAEHAVLHLLYARFWHKFLFDIGVVPTDEPFARLRNQGMILGMGYFTDKGEVIANDLVEEKNGKYYHIETGEELKQAPTKMSKSLKNVVNPDDIVKEYGADTLRLYEMYLSDFKDTAPWDTIAIVGCRRFLDKSYNYITGEVEKFAKNDDEAMKLLHKTIKKVGEDIENYKFNTAIAALMILINNGIPKDANLAKEFKQKFIVMLGAFAPFMAEELWNLEGNNTSIFDETWPKYDEKMLVEDSITIAISINGKARGEIKLPVNISKEEAIQQAKNTEVAQKWIEGKEIIKEIYVPNKLVNIVVK